LLVQASPQAVLELLHAQSIGVGLLTSTDTFEVHLSSASQKQANIDHA